MPAAERFVDLVLVVLVVEIAAWPLLRRRFPRMPPLRAAAANLAAGFFLVAAVRAALAGQGIVVLGPLLALAGAAHVADLRARLRR